jgi:hypothetical protein
VIRRRRVDMVVGEPVDLSAWAGRNDHQASVEATATIMAAVTALVEQARGEPFEPVD